MVTWRSCRSGGRRGCQRNTVTVRRDGYVQQTHKVDVGAGAFVPLDVALKPNR